MLHGRDPRAALAIIVACGLYDVVFVPPEQPLDSIATPQLAVKALACSFIAAHVFDLVPLPADEKRLIFFASALAPFVGAVHNDKKNKSVSTVSMIIRDLVKLPLKDATSICLLHDCAANWQEKVPDIAAVAKLSRREIGLIVRKAGQLWIPSVVFAAAYNLSNTVKITPFGDSYHHLTTGISKAFSNNLFERPCCSFSIFERPRCSYCRNRAHASRSACERWSMDPKRH